LSSCSKRAKPRETAIISEIDGVVRFGEIAKGQRKIYVRLTTETRRNTRYHAVFTSTYRKASVCVPAIL